MRFLLTGASGFIGSHVARALLRAGHDVAAILRDPHGAARLADVADDLRLIPGSLEQIDRLMPDLRDFRPEAVLHFAWTGVGNSHRNDLAQVDNIALSAHLMKVALALDAGYFLGFGTQAEYGPCQARIAEDQPARPTTLYGTAKYAAGLTLARMAEPANMGFAWLRLFSSYGPDDAPNWIISYLIDEFLRGGRPALTACEQRWDFIYIDDVVAAVMAAVDRRIQGTFNLGSGSAVPLRDVVLTIRDAIDPGLDIGFGEIPYRPDQVMHLEADISALRAASGWTPRVSIREGVTRTIEGRRRLGAGPHRKGNGNG